MELICPIIKTVLKPELITFIYGSTAEGMISKYIVYGKTLSIFFPIPEANDRYKDIVSYV